LVCLQLRADVGLLLSEPTGEGASVWTSAGHASVYLSNICPESPIKMRLCGPGEPGSVITNYKNFGEDVRVEWNIVSLNVLLYGVEDEKDRPLYASQHLRWELQDAFWRRTLVEVCAGPPCSVRHHIHWRDMVAASFVREIYLFEVRTTREQDLALIAKFNAAPNVDRYNGFTNNCADFSRYVLNTYFANAAEPDRLNDFGLTSPKAISKSFSMYGERHPELEFHVVRFAQIPGSFKPSAECRKGTEVAFRSKKWLIPLLLKSHELGLFALSYFLTGRFDPAHELSRRPTEQIAELTKEVATARTEKDGISADRLRREIDAERHEALGTSEAWKGYSEDMNRLVREAIAAGLIHDRHSLAHVFHDFDAHGTTFVDETGAVWLTIRDGESIRTAGVSLANIDAPQSDPQLAYLVVLARVAGFLRTPRRSRELMPEFKEDWALLERTHTRWVTLAQSPSPAPPSPNLKTQISKAGIVSVPLPDEW